MKATPRSLPAERRAHPSGSAPLSRRASLQIAWGTCAAFWAGLPRISAAAEAAAAPAAEPGVLLREFIYEHAPFPSCHASTVVETRRGLLAAWFGGTDEGADDVCIYQSRRLAGGWSAPVKVADGIADDSKTRHPCWNPVLFQPRNGPLLLFYKVGPSPSRWWGMIRTSRDQGNNWSPPRRLPEGQLGPIRAKPVQLADGTILCGSSTEDSGWRVQMEWTNDPLGSWFKTPPLNRAEEWGAIQPTILPHGGGDLQILCRSRQQAILESWSKDGGKTWSPLAKTDLPNPSAGIDAIRLQDGRFLLVYNHTVRGREHLNVAVSTDGKRWLAAAALEDSPGEYSYPAMIQSRNGEVHITYTWKRTHLRHVALDPRRLDARPIVNGRWPA